MIDEKVLIDVMLKSREREHGTVKSLIDWFIDVINTCPKVDRWIPTSEGLPKEDGVYLCQIDCGHCELINTLDFSTNLYKVSEYEFYDKKRAGFYDCDGEWGRYEVDDVVAWQPLPALYKNK